MSKSILITGATGQQGGATITALLANNANFEILAVTRNPESPSAQKLAAKSSHIKLVKGNLNDIPSLFATAKAISPKIWGVFSVQTMIGDGASPITEEAQGKAMVDAALANGVEFFVYTSVDRHGEDSFNNPTNVPHFISKHNIEHHLVDSARGTNMKYTILRPVTFMDGLSSGFIAKIIVSAWKIAQPEKPLQMIATVDIGVFAAKAFMDPERFAGRAISLAGDALTITEAEKIWKEKLGTEMPRTFGLVGKAFLWASAEMGSMFRWFNEVGCDADIEALRKEHPGLVDFGTWVDENVKK